MLTVLGTIMPCFCYGGSEVLKGQRILNCFLWMWSFGISWLTCGLEASHVLRTQVFQVPLSQTNETLIWIGEVGSDYSIRFLGTGQGGFASLQFQAEYPSGYSLFEGQVGTGQARDVIPSGNCYSLMWDWILLIGDLPEHK